MRTRPRISGTLVMALLLFGSCGQQDPAWIGQEPGHSILDLEYINDTLGIRLKDIRVAEIAPDSFRISVYVIPGPEAAYDSSSRFFLHLYEHDSKEGDGSFMAVGTRALETKNGALIYYRQFRSDKRRFEKLRYGMVAPDGRRLFTLDVDTLDIEL